MPGKAAPHRPVLHRSVSMAALHGGKTTLQRIMESHEARIDPAGLENAVMELRNLLEKEPLSFNTLQVGVLSFPSTLFLDFCYGSDVTRPN